MYIHHTPSTRLAPPGSPAPGFADLSVVFVRRWKIKPGSRHSARGSLTHPCRGASVLEFLRMPDPVQLLATHPVSSVVTASCLLTCVYRLLSVHLAAAVKPSEQPAAYDRFSYQVFLRRCFSDCSSTQCAHYRGTSNTRIGHIYPTGTGNTYPYPTARRARRSARQYEY